MAAGLHQHSGNFLRSFSRGIDSQHHTRGAPFAGPVHAVWLLYVLTPFVHAPHGASQRTDISAHARPGDDGNE